MFTRTKTWCISILLLMSAVFCAGSSAVAQDAAWRVGKASGDVWVTKPGVQPASLGGETTLQPGDTIRTGQTGRVLLVRGKESILISPNSIIGIPTKNADGMSTTIIQRAGSILLEVEKQNVKHFEVDTPYLAAVVKGTHFRVSAEEDKSDVNVLRGQVEVRDFKSGQFALVTAGQKAEVSANRSFGLSLSGAGTLGVIQQGVPRTSPVTPVSVRTAALSAPPSTHPEQANAASRGVSDPSFGGNGVFGVHQQGIPSSSSVMPVSVRAARLFAPTGGAHPEQVTGASRGLSGPSHGGDGAFGVHQQGIPSSSSVTPVSVWETGLFAPTNGLSAGQTQAAAVGLPDLSFNATGALGLIQKDEPRGSPVTPVSVWATGLLADAGAEAEQDQAPWHRSSILPRSSIKSLLASSDQVIPQEERRASVAVARVSSPTASDNEASEADTPRQGGFLSTLAVPLGIALFVTFAVTLFRRKEKSSDDHPPEYNY